jgi:phosphopantetheinyl transferase (holo-ACP synthase)
MTFNASPTSSNLSIDVFSKALSNQDLGLCAYSDASFADAEDRKSTSGYLFKFAGGTICYKSCKQKLITTLTTKAEYVALTYAAKEATWLVRLLEQIGYLGNDVYLVKLYGDNKPSIQLVSAEGYHERTKHVNIYYHYIKDRVKEGHLSLQHIRTHDMAADGLTKPLDKLAHRRFLDQVGLRKPIINSALAYVPAQD